MSNNIEETNELTRIEERPLDIYKKKLKNSQLDYPKSKTDKENDLPNLFFNALWCGARQSGKTYSCSRMIRAFQDSKMITKDGEEHKVRVIWISPTTSANQSALENLDIEPEDIYEEYSDEILEKIMKNIDDINDEVKKYKLYVETYKLIDKTSENKIPALLKRRPEINDILKEYDYKNPDEIDIKYKTRPITFICLDDLMGSDAFNRKAQSKLLYYAIRNRHRWLSFFFLLQSMKACPKSIRMNCNLFFLSKCASKKYILNDLYEEVSNYLTEQEFSDMYDLCCQEKYGALVMDFTKDEKKFYNNLDKELILIK